MKLKELLCVTAAIFMLPNPVFADSKKDFQTISKAVSFVKGGPKGDVVMDVLYDSSNPDSVAHADEIASIVSGGIGKKVKLTANKVSDVASVTSKIVFVTRGTSSMYASALDKASANGGLTVSTDSDCLGSGCVLVVKTQPKVDILVSSAAASKAGIEFASAFRMMITEK